MTNNITDIPAGKPYFLSTGSNTTGSNNLWFGSGSGPSQTTGNLSTNPLLAAPPGDLHLQSGSPAIGAGVTISGLLTDHDGVSRPQAANGQFAIGAYEFNTGAAPPPPSSCDVNGDGVVNVADVQLEVNMALGINSCTNPSGTCTVVSVQRVVNAALGGQCVSL
jgi:hypothetical protein